MSGAVAPNHAMLLAYLALLVDLVAHDARLLWASMTEDFEAYLALKDENPHLWQSLALFPHGVLAYRCRQP